MASDDRADERETEAETGRTRVVSGAPAVELLVDLALLGAPDAGAVIGDDDLEPALRRSHGDRDLLCVAGVLPRIRQQIQDRAHERRSIAGHEQTGLDV